MIAARRWERASGVAFALVVGLFAARAGARLVVYTTKSGDTPESIAADYYGNRSLSLFLLEGNGLERNKAIKPGTRVRIPTAFRYRVKKGETLEGLAVKFLEDRRRAPYLAQLSGLKPNERLREGQELLVPFQHVHRAEAPESLQSVARAFYGDGGKARLLAEYNFRSSPMLAKGDRLLVPVSHVRIRAVRLQPAPPEKLPGRGKPEVEKGPALAAAPPREAQKREAELAARVGKQLGEAERSYKDGNYSDVPALLDKLLTDEDPSEAQLADIFRLKAFAYVALGLDELAANAFREVLARKPELRLDEATVSPKIRAALERAKKAP